MLALLAGGESLCNILDKLNDFGNGGGESLLSPLFPGGDGSLDLDFRLALASDV